MGLHTGRIQTMPTCCRERGSTCAAHWYQPTPRKFHEETHPRRLLMAMLFLGVYKEKHWSATMLAHPVSLLKFCCEVDRHLS